MLWGMPGMMLIGAVVWLAFLVAIGVGVWWLIRQAPPARHDPALEALRERYARGEIDREEYETRRRDLAA
jgi:putative membrane protein